MSIIVLPPPSASLGQGDPNVAITGTKVSGPRGIESVLEYNGLYLNIRDWIDTYVIESINGLDDADVRDAREVNPDDHGETPFDSWYGGRPLIIAGHIETRTIWKLRDMQQALRQAFSDIKTERPLYFRTNDANTDMMIMCKKTQPIQMADEQTTANGFERKFQITLRASNFRFLSFLEHFQTFTMPSAGPLLSHTLVNNGDFGAQPNIRIYGPLDAAVAGGTALTMTVDQTGEDLIIKAKPGQTSVVSNLNYLEIDIHSHTLKEYVAATNAFVGNAFDRLDVGSDWPELPPGQSTITSAVTSGSRPEIQVRHRDTYL